MAKMHLVLRVNKKQVEALAEPRMLLIHLLREQLGITGPHIGCDTSHCGACTVDMNGKSAKSCTVFAVQAQGADIITVEGLVGGDGSLHPLQEAFREHHGLHCGFCTPGMITRAYRLLQENPNPSETEIRYGIAGNLCRCTGYLTIVRAIRGGGAHEWRKGDGRMTSEIESSQARTQKLEGLGTRRKRVEDIRFTQGKGNYVDDLKFP